jgi:putative ABC transport system ATP-binding protein
MLLIKNVKKTFHEPGGGRLPILDIEEFRLDAGEQAVLL